MNREDHEIEIDFLQLARALWEKVKYIILVTIIFGILGVIWSTAFYIPVYEASAKMIVINRNEDAQYITNDQVNSTKSLMDTYAIIIRSRSVLNEVIEELGLSESYGQVQSAVSVKPVNNTSVMKITVRHTNPATACAISAKILEIAPDIIVSTVGVGSVKTVEGTYANPNPVSSSPLKKIILMAGLGFLLACSAIAVIFLLDNTYKTDADIQRDLDMPMLGVIPKVECCGKHSRYSYMYGYDHNQTAKSKKSAKKG